MKGGRNKDESLYVFPSPATYFNLLYPTLPTQVKVKRWKSERMQAPYKEQKASNAVHLPLYWNVLSFSFTIIEFSWYKLSSGYAAHLYSLLSIGRIAWYKLSSGYAAHLYSLLSIGRIAWYKFLSSYAAHLSPWKGEIERGLLTYLCSIIVALAIFSPLHLFTLSSLSCLQIVSFHVVKKSEATSRECSRNDSTCSRLVKM